METMSEEVTEGQMPTDSDIKWSFPHISPGQGSFPSLTETEGHLAVKAAKQAQIEALTHAYDLEHTHYAVLKTFDAPVSSCKWKDNPKDIAAPLDIDQSETIHDILTYCQEHLAAHPELEWNPHFTALFSVPHTHGHPPSGINCLTPFPNMAPLHAFNVSPSVLSILTWHLIHNCHFTNSNSYPNQSPSSPSESNQLSFLSNFPFRLSHDNHSIYQFSYLKNNISFV